MLVKPVLIEQDRILGQMKNDARNGKQWDQRRGGRLGAEGDLAEKRDAAKNLICLKLREWYRCDKPGALREEGDQ
jgi:hypothetical protein